MKTTKIETNNWDDVKPGDRIAILRENCNYLGIKVEEERGRIFMSEKSFGRRHSSHKTYFDVIPEDWELRSIVREDTPAAVGSKPKWKFTDLFKKAAPVERPKVGSQEAIQEAIDSTDSIVDYFDTRIQLGDPLFDQWMVDAHESAKASSENLRKLLKVMKGEE